MRNCSVGNIARRQFVATNCACPLYRYAQGESRNHFVLIGRNALMNKLIWNQKQIKRKGIRSRIRPASFGYVAPKRRKQGYKSERNGRARSSPSSVGRHCLRERLLPFPNWENTNGKPFGCCNGSATSSVIFPTWLRRKTPLGLPLPRTFLAFHYTLSSDFTALGIGLRTRYMMF